MIGSQEKFCPFGVSWGALLSSRRESQQPRGWPGGPASSPFVVASSRDPLWQEPLCVRVFAPVRPQGSCHQGQTKVGPKQK